MDKIRARFIIEILGKPKEHVSSAIAELVKRLEGEKGVTLIEKKIHEPVEIKEAKELFTTFSEIEAEFESINVCFGILFAYMPSNFEILSPEKLKFDSFEMNSLINNLMARLHNYDAIAKRVINERDILANRLRQLVSKDKLKSNEPVKEESKDKSEKPKKKSKKSS